jgi:hypothetical protein
MGGAEIICSQCGMLARLIRLEGEVFPVGHTEKPKLFQIIECPQCGRREQSDGHDRSGRGVK